MSGANEAKFFPAPTEFPHKAQIQQDGRGNSCAYYDADGHKWSRRYVNRLGKIAESEAPGGGAESKSGKQCDGPGCLVMARGRIEPRVFMCALI